MRANFRTIKFLTATTALIAPNAMFSQRAATCRLQRCGSRHFMSQPLKSIGTILAANLPAILISLGAVIGAGSVALADSASDPSMIPLQHVPDEQGDITWLGIMAGINDGSPRLYMFDTGSDQFNAQIAPDTTGVKTVPGAEPKAYLYGDSTTANWVRRVQFKSLSYYDPDDISTPIATFGGKYQAGKVLDILFTDDHRKDHPLSDEPVVSISDDDGKETEFYAARDIHESIEKDEPGEQPPFYGIFGAGDFLFSNSAPSSAIGGHTKSGYIVSANANLDTGATPGCAPCLIVDLNSSLRAQFTSYARWGEGGDGYYETFPGSGANASTEYEGEYNLEFTVGGNNPLSVGKVAVLLDTGTPRGGELQVTQAKFDDLKNSGVEFKEYDDAKGRYYVQQLEISVPTGESIPLNNIIDVTILADDAEDDLLFIGGLEFFLSASVMYDLEKQATAYTPYFVTTDNFTTDAAADGELQLNRITSQMGSLWRRDKLDANGQPVLDNNGKPVQESFGQLGIAGVISGSGDLTLDQRTDVRLTGVNTYTGTTYISRGASLSLAGPGNIEHSSNVVNDGELNISQHGKFNPNWGVSKAQNDAAIRSLSGNGQVQLGDRTLVLTAANDTFSGRITDIVDDETGDHMGGGLTVAGGVQTLSGANDFTGVTTVGPGAALLLADSGSLKSDVTVSGLFGGAGTSGTISVSDAGKIAPGSAMDPNSVIATLTVNGDLVQQAGSIYEAGIAPSSSDLIDISGQANIDGGADVEIVRQGVGPFALDTRYTLLTAAQGVSGTYAGLTGTFYTDSPFVDFELAYDPTNVYLDVYRSATAFADVGQTFNERSTAAAAEGLGAGNPIHDSILPLTTDESRNAFNRLSGEVHASAKTALMEDSRFLRDVATNRVRAAFGAVAAPVTPIMSYGPDGLVSGDEQALAAEGKGARMVAPEPVSAPATTERFAFWSQAFGSWGRSNGDGNAAKLKRDAGGVIIGADGLIADTWRLGILAGYSRSSFDVDGRASSGDADNYHVGLYGGTQWGDLGLRFGAAHSWHDIETSRSVAFPGFVDSVRGSYDARTAQVFGEVGYEIDRGRFAFEPFANLAYVNVRTDSFAEEGGAAALRGSRDTMETTFTTLGLRASTDFTVGTMKARARGMLGWRHAFGDVTPTATHTFSGDDAFAIAGAPIAENAAVIEAGLDLNLSDAATLGLSYNGQIANDAHDHGVKADFTMRF